MPMPKAERALGRILAIQHGSRQGVAIASKHNPVRCPACRAKVWQLMASGVCRECEVTRGKEKRR